MTLPAELADIPAPLKVPEVARVLGCSPQTVTRHIDAGNLTALNIAVSTAPEARRHWRVGLDAVRDFVTARAVGLGGPL